MSKLFLQRPRIAVSVILAAVFAVSAAAQHSASSTPPATPPQLSPRAAYDDAMRPLEITRQSFSNWSETEIAAFQVTIAKASGACAARDPKALTGTDLVDMERLCALGQNWPRVVDAADRYIASNEATQQPRLSEAYSMLVDAHLRLHDEPDALASTRKMLATAAYDALAANAVDEAINYMQFNYTADAIAIAVARQPLLLQNIATLAQPPSAPSAPSPDRQNRQSLHELYAEGIVLPVLQGYTQPATAAATLATLDAALPSALVPDDAIPIAATRRRYALLSKPLSSLRAVSFLSLPGKVPELPAANAITALLLFPDWCAQCVRMAGKFPETVVTVSGHEAYLYGVLATTVPQTAPQPESQHKLATKPLPGFATFSPADATNLLHETPTLVVKPATLDAFTATDVPFLVIADSHGIVRVAQPVGEDAIQPGNAIDSAIAMVGARWPLQPSQPVQPPAPTLPASSSNPPSSQNP